MFRVLPESSGRRERGAKGTVVSVVVHTMVIGLVAAATATGRVAPPPSRPDVVRIPLPNVAPADRRAGESHRRGGAGRTGRTSLPTPPAIVAAPSIDIPPAGPIDIPMPEPVGPAQGHGGEAGLSSCLVVGSCGGTDGGGGTADGEGPASNAGVDQPAALRPAQPSPRYPELLRQAHVTGSVIARFVVDTTGRAEPGSLQIVQSAHPGLEASVRETIPRLRFLPATNRGAKVRVLVELPFEFAIR